MPSLRILEAHGNDVDPALVDEVAAALESGCVVALPTETVYGLSARISKPEAIERIFAMKGRPPEKALPYLIPDADAVFNFVNAIPRKAKKLIDRFWPGPLTLVLGPGDGVALRLPDHPWTRAVLRKTAGPVVATSANRSGEKPATTARRVERFFNDSLDLLLDAGKSRLGVESSIVRVTDHDQAEILRVGHLSEEAILQTLATTVVLVCTGNTCRSPMAQAVLQSLLAERLNSQKGRLPRAGYEILSAGLSAFPGTPLTKEAEDALARRGFALPDHRSRPLTAGMSAGADLLLAMTESHRAQILANFPETRGRVELLDPNGHDIKDPFGLGTEDYESCLDRIQEALRLRIDKLLGPAAKPESRPESPSP